MRLQGDTETLRNFIERCRTSGLIHRAEPKPPEQRPATLRWVPAEISTEPYTPTPWTPENETTD